MVELNELRTCKGCKIEKPLIDYYKYRKNSYRGKCKCCFNQNIQKWKKANKDVVNDQFYKWVDNNREKWNGYMKGRYDPEKRHQQHLREYIRVKNKAVKA